MNICPKYHVFHFNCDMLLYPKRYLFDYIVLRGGERN